MYLCVLRGDLQQQSQSVVIEGFVEGEQRSVDSALVKVSAVLFEADGLNPADDALVTPHQHFCNDSVITTSSPTNGVSYVTHCTERSYY